MVSCTVKWGDFDPFAKYLFYQVAQKLTFTNKHCSSIIVAITMYIPESHSFCSIAMLK